MQRVVMAIVVAVAVGGAESPRAGVTGAGPEAVAGQRPVPPLARAALREMLVAAGFEPEDAGNGVWAIAVDGHHAETIHLIVASFDGLAIVQSLIQRGYAATDPGATAWLLRRSYRADLAKVGLTEDGRLQALHETELRTLDADGLKRIIDAVATLADDVRKELAEAAPAPRAPLTGPPSGATLHALTLLDGRVTVEYDTAQWREVDRPDDDPMFEHSSGMQYTQIISEAIEIPLEGLLSVALANARRADPKVLETARGIREVNGVTMHFMEFDATIDGIALSFLGHYYVDEKGAVQILGWSRRELMGASRDRIESFVSGFRVRAPKPADE